MPRTGPIPQNVGFGEHAAAIDAHGWAVANGPRPLPGEIIWTGPLRHGTYYAAGPEAQYRDGWQNIDAWPVHLVSNENILWLLNHKAQEAGIPLHEVLEDTPIPQLAEQYGFPWHTSLDAAQAHR